MSFVTEILEIKNKGICVLAFFFAWLGYSQTWGPLTEVNHELREQIEKQNEDITVYIEQIDDLQLTIQSLDRDLDVARRLLPPGTIRDR